MNPQLVQRLLKALEIIFGKGFIPRIIGQRTNVIRIPDNNMKRFLKEELNIAEASDRQVESAKDVVKEMANEITKMNDQELLTFTNNVERLAKRVEPEKVLQTKPKADVLQFETGEKVTPNKVESLIEKQGQVNPPGTLMGNIESRLNKIRNIMEEPEKIIPKPGSELERMFNQPPGMMGKEYHDAMNQEFARKIFNKYSPDEAEQIFKYYNDKKERAAFLRATESAKTPYSIMTPVTREIIREFVKAKKLKLSPGATEGILKGDGSGLRGKPVETFQYYFGNDNLEALDTFVEANLGTGKNAKEIAKQFIEEYPKLMNPTFLERVGGKLTPIKHDKDLLTYSEKASFLHGIDDEGKALTKEQLDYLRKNIDPNDPDITSHIMQYAVDGPKEVKNWIKNTPEGYTGPSFLKKVLPPKNPTPVETIVLHTDETVPSNLPEPDNVIRNPEKLTPKKPEEPEEFANGGRVGYGDGTKPSAEENTPSQEIINRMIAQIKQLSKRGVDIATIKDIVGASDQMIKDVLGKASGGSMSKGLDYLMGIDRKNYQTGSYPLNLLIKQLIEGSAPQPIENVNPNPKNISNFKQTFTPKGVIETAFMLSNPVAYGAGKLFSSGVQKATGYTPTQNIQNALASIGIGSYATAPAPDAVFGMGERDMGNFTVDVDNFGGITGGADEDRYGGGYDNDGNTGGMTDSQGNDTSPGATGGAGGESGVDSAGDGGDGYATGGRVKYLKGGLSYLVGL